MPDARLWTVRMPCPTHLDEYRSFLRDTIYRAVDRLEEEGLLDAFYVALRGGLLELHLALEPDAAPAAVEAALKAAGVSPALEPGETLPEGEVDRLDAVSHLLRLVHEAEDPSYALNQALHYALNQAGFAADAQAHWHAVQAFVWLHSHFAAVEMPPLTLELVDETIEGLRGMLRH